MFTQQLVYSINDGCVLQWFSIVSIAVGQLYLLHTSHCNAPHSPVRRTNTVGNTAYVGISDLSLTLHYTRAA